jgi:hypothetical protein
MSATGQAVRVRRAATSSRDSFSVSGTFPNTFLLNHVTIAPYRPLTSAGGILGVPVILSSG